MRILTSLILCAGLGLAATPCYAGDVPHPNADQAGARVITVTSRGPNVERITLALGKAAVVQLDTDARDVMVSDPSTVDAVVRTPRRVFLLAQKIGQTNAFFFDGSGHQILSVDIRVERDVSDLITAIKADMPDSNVRVSTLNDNIVLTGSVAGAQDAARVQELAAQFVRDPGKTVDPTKVVNMLRVGSHEQVMLKVRVAEMQRQIAKQFGINLMGNVTVGGVPLSAGSSNPYGLVGQALSSASGAQFGLACGQAANTLSTLTASTAAAMGAATNLLNSTTTTNGVTQTVNSNSASSNNSIQGSSSLANTHCVGPNNTQGLLNALEQTGLLHTLAEPNMTAVSGETAKFLAGGEFPVPGGRDQQGNVQIIFKQFGVGLSFTPVVLSDRRISLQLSTEVSELTNTGAFTLQGGTSVNPQGQEVQVGSLTIPALDVRRAETTVEMPSGGSFAIAGLLQHTNKQVLDAFPGLKDMPVLGALFRSRDFQNDETELVVIVSTYLVEPTSAKKLAAPTDGFANPSDVETIAEGKLNKVIKPDPHVSSADSKVGFIVE